MDQHRSPEQPVDRARAVRRAGTLRRTLVGSSAAASLGVAVVLGLGAVGVGSTNTTQPSTAQGTQSTQGTRSATSTTTTTPNLSAGAGSSIATTSGS